VGCLLSSYHEPEDAKTALEKAAAAMKVVNLMVID
jgi:hypothetical protein